MFQTPKQRFLASNKEAAAFIAELSATNQFQGIVDAALLQTLHELPTALGPHESAQAHAMMMGARAFAKVLLNLGDVPPPPKRLPSSDNLNHAI